MYMLPEDNTLTSRPSVQEREGGEMNEQAKISIIIPESCRVHTDLCQRLDREANSIATRLRIVYSPDSETDGRIEIQYRNSSDGHFTEDIITPERFEHYCQQIAAP